MSDEQLSYEPDVVPNEAKKGIKWQSEHLPECAIHRRRELAYCNCGYERGLSAAREAVAALVPAGAQVGTTQLWAASALAAIDALKERP